MKVRPWNLTSTTAVNVVSDPYLEPRTFYPALVLGIVSAWACFLFALDWYWCVADFLIFFIIAATLCKQVTIDYARRKVHEESRLFGERLVMIREFPFSDFEAIVYQLRHSENEDTAMVGLRHRSGRRIWIRTFPAGGLTRGRGAEAFAWRLSCDTGIQIDERTG